MSKKLTAAVGLFVVLAMLIGACAAPAAPAPAGEAATTATEAAAETTAETTAEAAAPSGEPFRIALIMPSTTTDYSWSQSIYDGIKQVQEEMGGEGALEVAVVRRDIGFRRLLDL